MMLCSGTAWDHLIAVSYEKDTNPLLTNLGPASSSLPSIPSNCSLRDGCIVHYYLPLSIKHKTNTNFTDSRNEEQEQSDMTKSNQNSNEGKRRRREKTQKYTKSK